MQLHLLYAGNGPGTARRREGTQVLRSSGISRTLAKRGKEIGREQGNFRVFSAVDALTRITRELRNAGDRAKADQKAANLPSLEA